MSGNRGSGHTPKDFIHDGTYQLVRYSKKRRMHLAVLSGTCPEKPTHNVYFCAAITASMALQLVDSGRVPLVSSYEDEIARWA